MVSAKIAADGLEGTVSSELIALSMAASVQCTCSRLAKVKSKC